MVTNVTSMLALLIEFTVFKTMFGQRNKQNVVEIKLFAKYELSSTSVLRLARRFGDKNKFVFLLSVIHLLHINLRDSAAAY